MRIYPSLRRDTMHEAQSSQHVLMLQAVYTPNLLVLRIELWKRLRVEGFYAPMEMG